MKHKNFYERLFWGLLITCITIGIIASSHNSIFQYLFPLTLTALAGIALWEYFQLAQCKKIDAPVKGAIIFSSGYFAFHFFTILQVVPKVYSELFLYFFALCAFIALFRKPEGSLQSLGITALGFVYITFPLSLMLDINYELSQSCAWLYFLIFTTKACDMGAYFAGKLFGRHQITPILSPKKTLEGVIGGCFAAIITACIFYFVALFFETALIQKFSLLECLFFGLSIAFATIMGDLAESLLKRDAGVKDSNTLPGFGGILDMLDSLIFTTPLVYIYLRAKVAL